MIRVENHVHDVVAVVERRDVKRIEAVLIDRVGNGAEYQQKLADSEGYVGI